MPDDNIKFESRSFPPKRYSRRGISRYVHDLDKALAAQWTIFKNLSCHLNPSNPARQALWFLAAATCCPGTARVAAQLPEGAGSGGHCLLAGTTGNSSVLSWEVSATSARIKSSKSWSWTLVSSNRLQLYINSSTVTADFLVLWF